MQFTVGGNDNAHAGSRNGCFEHFHLQGSLCGHAERILLHGNTGLAFVHTGDQALVHSGHLFVGGGPADLLGGKFALVGGELTAHCDVLSRLQREHGIAVFVHIDFGCHVIPKGHGDFLHQHNGAHRGRRLLFAGSQGAQCQHGKDYIALFHNYTHFNDYQPGFWPRFGFS